MPKPKVGAPSELTASPSGVRIFVLTSSKIWPVASSTSGTPRTVSSSPSSIGGSGGAVAVDRDVEPRPVTTASVPSYDSVKSCLKARSTVSVRM